MATYTGADGALVILSAGEDGTVRRWDAATGTPVGFPLTGHTDPVGAVAAYAEAEGGVVGAETVRRDERHTDAMSTQEQPQVPDPAPAVFGKTDPSQTDLYKYAADQTLTALGAQREELSTLRTRVVQLLAFLGTATAFLAGTVLKGTRAAGDSAVQLAYRTETTYQALLWIAGILALLAFMTFASVLTGRPKDWKSVKQGPLTLKGIRAYPTSKITWEFDIRGDVLASWVDSKIPAARFYREIARNGRQIQLRNRNSLKSLRFRYALFLVSILAQLAAWILLALTYG